MDRSLWLPVHPAPRWPSTQRFPGRQGSWSRPSASRPKACGEDGGTLRGATSLGPGPMERWRPPLPPHYSRPSGSCPPLRQKSWLPPPSWPGTWQHASKLVLDFVFACTAATWALCTDKLRPKGSVGARNCRCTRVGVPPSTLPEMPPTSALRMPPRARALFRHCQSAGHPWSHLHGSEFGVFGRGVAGEPQRLKMCSGGS